MQSNFVAAMTEGQFYAVIIGVIVAIIVVVAVVTALVCKHRTEQEPQNKSAESDTQSVDEQEVKPVENHQEQNQEVFADVNTVTGGEAIDDRNDDGSEAIAATETDRAETNKQQDLMKDFVAELSKAFALLEESRLKNEETAEINENLKNRIELLQSENDRLKKEIGTQKGQITRHKNQNKKLCAEITELKNSRRPEDRDFEMRWREYDCLVKLHHILSDASMATSQSYMKEAIDNAMIEIRKIVE